MGFRRIRTHALQPYPDRAASVRRNGRNIFFVVHDCSGLPKVTIMDFTHWRSSIASAVNVPSL
jgi:hypothetical protein